jgi:tRNA-specific 2-thiouridylase
LFSQAFYAINVNFISGSPPAKAFECTLKYRHLQPDRKAKVAVQDDGNLYVEFFEPQRAVCPGQYAVFYDGAVCLGGAEIDKTVGV